MLNGLVFSWHLNLITLIVLAILCLLYTLSILFAGRGGSHPPINMWRVVAFVSAMLAWGFFLFSSFYTLARTLPFYRHMVTDVVLCTLCAPKPRILGHGSVLSPVLC